MKCLLDQPQSTWTSEILREMVRILLCGDVRGDVPKVCALADEAPHGWGGSLDGRLEGWVGLDTGGTEEAYDFTRPLQVLNLRVHDCGSFTLLGSPKKN